MALSKNEIVYFTLFSWGLINYLIKNYHFQWDKILESCTKEHIDLLELIAKYNNAIFEAINNDEKENKIKVLMKPAFFIIYLNF